MNRLEQLQKALQKEGYRRMDTNLEQFTVYYQLVQGQPRGVLLAELSRNTAVSREQMKHVQEQIYFGLQRLGEHPAFLTLAAGEEAVRYREVFAELPACWLWDTKSGELFIYEHQPSSFFGVERLLEGVSEKAHEPKAVVNTAIIAANVLVFVLLELLGSTEDAQFMAEHGAAYAPWIKSGGEYWRLFSSMFLHFGMAHLGNNMLVLFLLGPHVERALGKRRYLLLYLVSGLAGSVASYAHALAAADYAVSAGASGAIFGMIGALFYIVLVNRGRLEDMTSRRLGILILVSLYHGFMSSGVDNYAHVGGLIGGVLLGAVLYRRKQKNVK